MKTDHTELAEMIRDQKRIGEPGSPEMKYVVFEREGMEHAIMFPQHFIHSNIGLSSEDSIVSAGFCRFNADRTVEVWGESSSLKDLGHPHKSREIDAAIIYSSYVVGYWTYMWPFSE